MTNYTFEDFDSQVGKPFQIEFGKDNIQNCNLIEAKKSLSVKNSFSLIFESPQADIYEQAIYSVKNSDLGDMELFLVPVNGDDQGVQYEAIFT